ncbi:VanZ family protein [Geojedonia litorea]|uniref:VanZ family protein n=1 Tax=Geojedonia litorea TaxID=1268269 RepID=A0ABV9N2J0_9FLAO
MAKHLALTVLVLYVALLTFFSLKSIGELPPIGFAFDDKIYHFLSYMLLTSLCYNYFRNTNRSFPILISIMISIIYGVLIEWLQGITSNLRISDAYDVVANILGTIFAAIVLSQLKNVKLK